MQLIKKITLASFMILSTFSHAYADGALDTSPGWHYSDSNDELRGSITHMAYVFANNDKPIFLTLMNSNDPHNKLTMLGFIDARKMPRLSSYYTMCKIKECSILLKIGDNPPEKDRVMSGDSSSIALLANPTIINKLKSSHKLIVEIEMIDGAEQYTFNLDGLQWN